MTSSSSSSSSSSPPSTTPSSPTIVSISDSAATKGRILAAWDSDWTIPAIVSDLVRDGYTVDAMFVMSELSRCGKKYAKSGLAMKGAVTKALTEVIQANGNSAIGRILAYSERKWSVVDISEELRKRGYQSSPELVRLVLEQNGVEGVEEGKLVFPTFDADDGKKGGK